MTDFETTRLRFHLPEGMIYLDGNSLGPLPKTASERAAQMIRDEWGELLIRGWNQAGWMDMPVRLGNRIAQLIGADEGSVVVGDTLSIKVYQALASAIDMRPDRKRVLSDSGNFPTDLYMAEGLLTSLGRGHELAIVDPEEVMEAIGPDVAVVMLTHVDYRTGRMHDMEAVTRKAQAAGAVVIWDLAHSAGAMQLAIAASHAEFAVGCTYKYLNGGPGAPAFIHVRPDIQDAVRPALSGWLGHAAPFDFEPSYRAGNGIARMRVGTPPVIQMAVLDAALDAWDGVDMAALRQRSVELCDTFIAEVESRCPELELASPRQAHQRGSQVSFRSENGYAIMQALIAENVIGDFRAPDIMRFGFTPLYVGIEDVVRAAEILESVIRQRKWDRPQFMRKAAVT